MQGEARMGLVDDFGSGGTAFSSRVRISFQAVGQTDGGLSFGASTRADLTGGNGANPGDALNPNNGVDSSVFLSGGGFTISMGDVDGAAQAAAGQVDGVGFTGLGDLNEIEFIGTGGVSAYFLDAYTDALESLTITGDPTLLLQYTTGDLSLYASVSQPTYRFAEACCTWTDITARSLGAAYAFDRVRVSLGYETWKGMTAPAVHASTKNLSLGIDTDLGPVALKARYAVGDTVFFGTDYQDLTQWAVSATYRADALSLTVFVNDRSAVVPGSWTIDHKAIGVGAAYDLGGGASLAGGIVRKTEDIDVDPEETTTAVDLGLNFTF